MCSHFAKSWTFCSAQKNERMELTANGTSIDAVVLALFWRGLMLGSRSQESSFSMGVLGSRFLSSVCWFHSTHLAGRPKSSNWKLQNEKQSRIRSSEFSIRLYGAIFAHCQIRWAWSQGRIFFKGFAKVWICMSVVVLFVNKLWNHFQQTDKFY